MKILGKLDLLGNAIANGKFEELETLPLNPTVGTWAFINKTLMLCIDIEGKPFWLPLTPERNTAVIPQSIASSVWMVNHNFGRETVMVQCFDGSNNVVLPSSITPIDENTTRVEFPDAVLGSTIVMFGSEDGTAISSGEFNNGGAGNPVSHIGQFPSKEAMEMFGTGYIGLDGQSIDYNTFPQLYLALGGTEGSTDLITLPDANGTKSFFRGGRLSSTGFEEIQGHELFKHNHGIQTLDVYNPDAVFTSNDKTGDYITSTDNGDKTQGLLQENRYVTELAGGEETRPINFSGYWGIKAYGAEINEGNVDVSSLLTRIQELENEKAASKIIWSGRVGAARLIEEPYGTGEYNVPFDEVFVNIGGIVYDDSDFPKFIVPRKGVYTLEFEGFAQLTENDTNVRILFGVNNQVPNGEINVGHGYVNIIDKETPISTKYEGFPVRTTVIMEAGDYITVCKLGGASLYNTELDKFNSVSLKLDALLD